MKVKYRVPSSTNSTYLQDVPKAESYTEILSTVFFNLRVFPSTWPSSYSVENKSPEHPHHLIRMGETHDENPALFDDDEQDDHRVGLFYVPSLSLENMLTE